MALAGTSDAGGERRLRGHRQRRPQPARLRAHPHPVHLGAGRPHRRDRGRHPGPRRPGDPRARLRPDPGAVRVGRQGIAGPPVRPDRGQVPARLGRLRPWAPAPHHPGQPLLPVGQRAEGERGQDLPGRDRGVPGQPVGPVGAGRGDRQRRAVLLRLLPRGVRPGPVRDLHRADGRRGRRHGPRGHAVPVQPAAAALRRDAAQLAAERQGRPGHRRHSAGRGLLPDPDGAGVWARR